MILGRPTANSILFQKQIDQERSLATEMTFKRHSDGETEGSTTCIAQTFSDHFQQACIINASTRPGSVQRAGERLSQISS